MNTDISTTWLVAGLGNPGSRYEATYHNMGRIVAGGFAAGQQGFDHRWSVKFKGEFCRLDVGQARVFVLLPDTYMNLSGQAVAEAAAMYKIDMDRLIVVHDDLDLDPGYIRVRRGGGDGGHKGVTSCVLSLGSADFIRVRIGIGRHPVMDPADYVLCKISNEHVELLKDAAQRGVEAIEAVISKGVKQAMNDFNRRQRSKEEEEETVR